MMRWGRAVALGFAAWLTACSGEQTGAQCPDCVTETSPPRYAPPLGQPMLVAPDGLGAQGAPCAQDAECSSKLCWRGFCDWRTPIFNGGGPGVTGQACTADADCQSVFCDRGLCAQPFRHYGIECEPHPVWDPMKRCGVYICAEGRCRSCQSDAECVYWVGAETCGVFGDNWPGKSCGSFIDAGPPGEPAKPPPMTPWPPRP